MEEIYLTKEEEHREIFFRDKVKTDDITNACHIGVEFRGANRCKIIQADYDSGYMAIRKDEDSKTVGKVFKDSKKEYIKYARKHAPIAIKIFKNEDALDNWVHNLI